MRILRIIYDWPPPWDGLAPAPFAFTKAQSALGNEIHVICGGGSLLFKKREAASLPGVKVTRLPRTLPLVGPFFTTAVLVPFAYFYQKLTWKPEVIHGHGHVNLWLNVYKYFFGWLDKTPYVLHFHNTAAGRELNTHKSVPFFTRYVEWPLHKLSDWLGTRVADKLVFVSSETAEEAKNLYGADPAKVIVLENGVDCELFNPSGQKTAVFPSGKTLLYQGSLKSRKRVDVLIKSLALLPSNINLALIGPDTEPNLHQIVVDLKLEKRVKFLGYLQNSETPQYFRSSTLFVIPSSYEGFPKVVLESLACGLPVLASGFKVEPPVGGMSIKEFSDEVALAASIGETLMNLPAVDVTAIKTRFDWSVLAARLQVIYESMAH
ncbi:MAG: glycosyltransferase family 4 protein [candidate division WWE3 bacterium]|nr:glycosyltransferase family 4 protein [candidate division WWE3 bacterium]